MGEFVLTENFVSFKTLQCLSKLYFCTVIIVRIVICIDFFNLKCKVCEESFLSSRITRITTLRVCVVVRTRSVY